MKNSKLTKIIAVVASLVLVISATLAITAMADEESVAPSYTSDVGIISTNVSYQAHTQLAFAVSDNGTASAGAESREVYLLFFNSNPDENGDLNGRELYQSAAYRKQSSGTVNVSGETALLFYSDGILARNLGKDVYVCPVVVERFADADTVYTRGYTTKSIDGADPIYSARACSVVTYARQQIETKESFKVGELELYSNILRYSSAVAVKEGDSSNGNEWLIVNGGVIGKNLEGNTQIRVSASDYASDELVVIRAEAEVDGEYFLYWKDVYGDIASTSRVCSVPAHNEIGLSIYTSVYGTAEDAAYASILNLDDMDEGELVPYEIPTEIPTSGYTLFESTVGCFKFAERIFWQTNADTSAIEVAARAVIKAVKSESGDGELVFEKSVNKFMPTQTINNEMNTEARGFEFDLKVSELGADKKNIRIIAYSNGSSGDVQFSMALHFYQGSDGKYAVKVSSRKSAGNYTFNKDITNPLTTPMVCNMSSTSPTSDVLEYTVDSADEILTVKYVIDDTGAAPVAKVYINGELMFIGSGAAISSNPYGYFESSANYVSGSAAINRVTIQADTQFIGTFAVDNIAFTDN